MFTLQLLGWVASTAAHNFDDWGYNQSQWWEGVTNNWAGGGGPSGDGDPALYLTEWPADSTVGILTSWFGAGGLGLDQARFGIWNMDNEPEIWTGTHDDIQTSPLTAEQYIQKYVAVAQRARAALPGIRLAGPVFTNEWQWWNWNNSFVDGLPWMAFFIKRIAEEQHRLGVRLLDVVDFHYYQTYDGSAAAEHNVTQLHRIWYDTTYDWPWANGSKAYPSGWDEQRRKQYIFRRVEQWLEQYMGTGHGVGVGLSEVGFFGSGDPNGDLAAVWYASHLGTFADHGVVYYTPWYWYRGMWEVMHLFSRYGKPIRVASVSDEDSVVSAYSSVNADGDSLSIILVNRDPAQSRQAQVTVSNFAIDPGQATCLELSGLPSGTETFVSHADNHLQSSTVTPSGSTVSLNLPSYSVTAVLLSGSSMGVGVFPVRLHAKPSLTERTFDLHGRPVRGHPDRAAPAWGIRVVDTPARRLLRLVGRGR
jgi:hypothetical protein